MVSWGLEQSSSENAEFWDVIMGRSNRRSILGQQIAEILGTANISGRRHANLRTAAAKSLICGSVALLVVAPAQVEAVGLGEISVQSTLGRPLQAIVPLSVGAGESVPADCVKPGTSRGDLTNPRNLRVKSPTLAKPGTHNLRISTAESLHEPMYELSLVINCPGTPVLVRHYVLMLDLPGTLSNAPAVEAAKPPAIVSGPLPVSGAAAQSTRPAPSMNNSVRVSSIDTSKTPRRDSSRALKNSNEPIQAGTSYRISQGDTLSTIAARIDGRLPDTTWAVAEQLFAMNPDAFIRNNPDLIKLGSLIQIPDVADLASNASVSPTSLTQHSEPAPEPAPQLPETVAAANIETSRSDTSRAVTQQAELVLESDLVPVVSSGDVYKEIDAAGSGSDPEMKAEAESINQAPALPEIDEPADAASSSPFADAETSGIADTSDTTPQVAQNLDVPTAEPVNDEISPWLAIGLGLLFGLGVSLLLLRERLTTAIRNLFSRREDAQAFATKMAKVPAAGKSKPAPSASAAVSDPFDTLAADAAFETNAGADDEVEPLVIGDPLEKTYIVETADHEPTQEVGESPLEKTDTSLQKQLDAPLNPVPLSPTEKSDDEMLAEIFEDIPENAAGHAATGMLEPTAQLPQSTDDEIFDPSGEFPGDLAGDVIDPTAEMALDPTTADIGPTLMQAFTEDLDKIEPEFMESSVQIDGAVETAESEQITTHAAEETSLDALPKSSEEDDILSETLYDALTLLEHDYEDEFTASQILERSAIKKSLATMDGENDDDDDTAERKLTG